MSEHDIRQEAYRYILEKFKCLPVHAGNPYQSGSITLSELMLLKEGLADPSAGLITLLKQLLRGYVTEAEIDAHLVAPFLKI